MPSSIYQSKTVEMTNLDNLFIELTSKCCNQRCKKCYIDFPMYKKTEDYIDIDIIKQALNDTMSDNIKCIYLSGAEPMTHPDFNSILRLCLKRSNVCVFTNGSFINEKKARFLKKVEEESSNEIIFKISIDHFDEIKNDDIRYRGAFRHGVFAVKHLLKYDFKVIISLMNYYNLSDKEIYEGFACSLKRHDISIDDLHFQKIPFYDKSQSFSDSEISSSDIYDCSNTRILTSGGVYCCPFLANDFRGRCGGSFADYNKKIPLETEYCQTCARSQNPMFSLNFSSL